MDPELLPHLRHHRVHVPVVLVVVALGQPLVESVDGQREPKFLNVLNLDGEVFKPIDPDLSWTSF